MKSWKSQWKTELDKAVPKLNDKVKNQPINVTAEEKQSKTKVSTPVVKRKSFAYGLSAAAVALIAIVLCVTLIPLGGNGNIDTFAFVVEINPSVTISTDKNGLVTGIVSSNADADVVLSDLSVNELLGKSVDEVIERYVDNAARLGYLDVSNTSAVRISALDGGNELLNKVGDCIETYFMEKGFMSVVLTEVVDLTTFAERSKLELADNVKSAVASIKNFEPIFRNRGIEDLSNEQIKQTYQGYLSADMFVTALGEYLNGEMDKIEQNERDIADIAALNDEIESHPQNKGIGFKDYWMVKHMHEILNFGDEFDKLIKQMDDKLERYNAAYGEDITSVIQLQHIQRLYENIPTETIRSLLQNFTAEVLNKYLSPLTQIMQTVTDNDVFASLITLPETAADFTAKIKDVITVEFASREKKFESIYNEFRESLTQSEYNEFKRQLFDEYGSANDLWEKLK